MIDLFAISGSLRKNSINTALLYAARRIAPEGVSIKVYKGLASIPLFNPDLEGLEPDPVLEFRRELAAADGIIIASPEYAHGVTGAMKNALDWTVASGEFMKKPVALLNASMMATLAYTSLKETLLVMESNLVAKASRTIPHLRRDWSVENIMAQETAMVELRTAIEELVRAVQDRPDSTNLV